MNADGGSKQLARVFLGLESRSPSVIFFTTEKLVAGRGEIFETYYAVNTCISCKNLIHIVLFIGDRYLYL